MLHELDIYFFTYDIRSNSGLSIKFDLKFDLKFLVNTVSDFRRVQTGGCCTFFMP